MTYEKQAMSYALILMTKKPCFDANRLILFSSLESLPQQELRSMDHFYFLLSA
jgi:hypothetical protein